MVVLSFMSSLIFAPWSKGIVYFFVFVYFWEVGKFLFYYGRTNDNTLIYILSRLSIILASILGWYLGRVLICEDKPHSQIFDLKDYFKSYFNF